MNNQINTQGLTKNAPTTAQTACGDLGHMYEKGHCVYCGIAEVLPDATVSLIADIAALEAEKARIDKLLLEKREILKAVGKVNVGDTVTILEPTAPKHLGDPTTPVAITGIVTKATDTNSIVFQAPDRKHLTRIGNLVSLKRGEVQP